MASLPLSLPSVVITSQIVLMMMMPAIRGSKESSCLLFVNLFCINVYLSCISELLCTNTNMECRTGYTKLLHTYVILIWPLPLHDVCKSAVQIKM